MKTLIHENVLTIKTLDEEIKDIIRNTTYVIEPEDGKLLRNKITGFTTDSLIGVGSNDSLNNYEEIDKE